MQLDPQRVQAVFLAVAECDDTQDRANLLARLCGCDTLLRERVAALLKAHDDPNALPPPAFLRALATSDCLSAYTPGMLIAGRYHLVEEIGEGGMGTVWVAQQSAPIQRQVALKLIKPGMDSRRVLSRFDAERQALALMEHPNIARVFDGGLTDEGRPFFAMEYVQGAAITEYCDRVRLTINERLKLFIDVCRAVHHAHQKGVIHRDLKPSNVLVSQMDDWPVPKVIDFGLAKAMHAPLSEDTFSAATELIVGTPKYMSPEQAQLNNPDIDTRADVYSLGVILYELLTGATPLENRQMQEAVLGEILRLVNEYEPAWPSARLAGSDSLESVATDRSAEPAQLVRVVRGDLDWIVMKALEKDRSRRYESANDLARDLERYLRDETVAARPPSTVYRLRKLARRHRLTLVASLLIAAALLVGTVVSMVLAVRATRAVRLAEAARSDEAFHRRRAEQQRGAAVEARAAEAAQRKIAQDERNEAVRRRIRAERNFREARTAIDAYFTSLWANRLLNVPALQPLRRELLDSALAYYRQRIDQHGDDPALEAELAVAYLRIGELTRAIGSKEQATEALQHATQRFEQLLQDRPEVREYWSQTAFCYNQLGYLQQTTGQLAGAEASFTRALDIRQKLAAEAPNDRAELANVGRAFAKLAKLYIDQEKLAEAEESFRRALEIHQGLVRDEPDVPIHWQDLGDAYYYYGPLQRITGRLVEAGASLQQARQIYEQLEQENQASLTYRARVAGAVFQLGHVQRVAGQFTAARSSYAHARQCYERLVRDDPSIGLYRRFVGESHFHLGLLQSIAGQQENAVRSWTTALAEFHSATELGYESIRFLSSRAGALALLGRWQEAANVLEQACAGGDYHWRPPCQTALLRWADGDAARYRAACIDLVARRGDLADPAEARAIATTCLVDPSAVDDWSGVLAVARRATLGDPADPVSLMLVGAGQYRAGDLPAARRSLEEALPLLLSAESSAPAAAVSIRASCVLGEAMLLLVYRDLGQQSALAGQLRTVRDLVDEVKSTVPLFCDEGDEWRVAFALLFAERELTRLGLSVDR